MRCFRSVRSTILPDENLSRARGRALMPRSESFTCSPSSRGAPTGSWRGRSSSASCGVRDTRGRPVGRRLRSTAAREAGAGTAGRASSTPTSASATGWPRSPHNFLTNGCPQLDNTFASAGADTAPTYDDQGDEIDSYDASDSRSRSWRRTAGLAACGSSSSSISSSPAAVLQLIERQQRRAGHDQRRRLDARGPDLPAVGLDPQVPGPDRQLQPGRLGAGSPACRASTVDLPAATPP